MMPSRSVVVAMPLLPLLLLLLHLEDRSGQILAAALADDRVKVRLDIISSSLLVYASVIAIYE